MACCKRKKSLVESNANIKSAIKPSCCGKGNPPTPVKKLTRKVVPPASPKK